MKEFVPFLQTLSWLIFISVVGYFLKNQLKSFLEAITTRIKAGSPLKIAGVELGQQPIIVAATADLGKDVEVIGNPDDFRLLFKVGRPGVWIKSTKAMQVPGGCVVQVTTERMNPDGSWSNAEALTFVPGVKVVDNGPDPDHNGRRLDTLNYSSESELEITEHV